GGRQEGDPVPVKAVLGGKCRAYNIRAQNRAHRTRAAAGAAEVVRARRRGYRVKRQGHKGTSTHKALRREYSRRQGSSNS
ncbi:unnamed protein product, partial [Laminaria digitata]